MKQSLYIRIFLARVLLVLMSAIVVSGILFLHKHSTRDGRIVIHVHPYDFTGGDSDNSDHHHSDEEIYHFNILYSGQYLGVTLFALETPTQLELASFSSGFSLPYFGQNSFQHFYLRGPPQG